MSKLSLVQVAEQHLESKIIKTQPLTQGDLSEAFIVTTSEGQNYVVKNGFSPTTEGKMLKFLEQHHIDVPKVIFANDHLLIMEAIQETNCLSKEAWQNLGLTLNKLHQIHHSSYGWKEDYAFGKLLLKNSFSSNWVEFWRENRLLCYINQLPKPIAIQIEKLIARLDHYIPTYPPISLLHGDLWSGNIITNINRPYLIDPACYFGHNEVDIAMLNIFGSPPEAFYNSYSLLEPDWQERLPIYQLFPAIVHYILFGDYYVNMIQTLLTRLKL
ncbi:fructosamine kinase family protein [Commensalibacter communis]|uniref:Fructosamine-3-kinase (FN3K) n=1 Tax=Commensalibacter communis TaxID=2972786 RepID=A0A9W4X674_9PROT|nr:fructosamine kinase family protein [Commensalibacter communis]CAI3923493.1 Fructosamine-3-kinase (FN3K) (PDB:3F7W) [Commensalibacter communis]CAI3929855.1 Fructosamine-3-kinase (FN3K) (PDB:3F7W) [Commensalibacter communis]CAI3931071.1 Fructosamine-3-kinase (FN3K) (PDB:3F7W) [Commensalibacter communis]CAI3931209.1 Fructosamine-3-kinase (FN3K) (PDB:3F7W) [Commensalibacter communis]CAI3931422.1 Fructosamine-3-kinase (FN3K) (PDB:3F7W) [Commensalibacter communis]